MMPPLAQQWTRLGRRLVPSLLDSQDPGFWSSRAIKHVTSSPQGGPIEHPSDRVILRGMTFHGFHGVLQEERVLGQKFVVDATLVCCLRAAGLSDNLAHTVNYAMVYEQIKNKVEGTPRQLIEALAEDIAAEILDSHPAVKEVQVYVQKPHVALPGVLASSGVEITRRRDTGSV